jgi:hypothetical protein
MALVMTAAIISLSGAIKARCVPQYIALAAEVVSIFGRSEDYNLRLYALGGTCSKSFFPAAARYFIIQCHSFFARRAKNE